MASDLLEVGRLSAALPCLGQDDNEMARKKKLHDDKKNEGPISVGGSLRWVIASLSSFCSFFSMVRVSRRKPPKVHFLESNRFSWLPKEKNR